MKRKQSYEFGDCLSGDEQGDETSYGDDDNDDNYSDGTFYALHSGKTSVQQNSSQGYNCGSGDHAGHRNCCDFTNCEFDEEENENEKIPRTKWQTEFRVRLNLLKQSTSKYLTGRVGGPKLRSLVSFALKLNLRPFT